MAIWEIAAGTCDKWFALLINIPALLYGFVLWPRVSYRAWQLGRRSQSLYNREFSDELLDQTVQELRAQTTGQLLG